MSNDKPDAPDSAADRLADKVSDKLPGKTIDLEATEIVSEVSQDMQAEASVETSSETLEEVVEGAVFEPENTDESLEDVAARLRIETASTPAPAAVEDEPEETAAAPAEEPVANQSPPFVAPAPKARSSFSGPLIGAVAGSFLSLAGLGALNASGMLQQIPGLSGLVASQPAEGQPASDPATPGVDLSGIEGRLSAVEADTAGLKEQFAGIASGAAQTPTGAADPQSSLLVTQLEQLAGRMNSAEKAIADLGAAQPAMPATGETAPVPPTGPADPQTGLLVTQLEQLAGRMNSAEKAIADLGANPATGESQAATSVFELQSGLAGAEEKIGVLSGRLDKVEESVAGYGEAQAQAANVAALASTMRALAGLESAFKEGKPFGDFLSQLEAQVVENPALGVLKSHAETGIANEAALVAELDAITPAILAGSGEEPQGVMGKFIANAKNLVTVRPEGPIEGNTPDAILSRIRAGVQSGDLAAALLLWQGLPEAARTASEEWSKRLQLRLDGAKAVQTLVDALGQEKAG